jgi:hypothetical protein
LLRAAVASNSVFGPEREKNEKGVRIVARAGAAGILDTAGTRVEWWSVKRVAKRRSGNHVNDSSYPGDSG